MHKIHQVRLWCCSHAAQASHRLEVKARLCLNGPICVQLPEQALPQQDVSVKDWMRSRGVSARAIELADVCYANDFGTGLATLGLTEAILEARTWDAGEEYLIKDLSFEHLVAHLSRGVRITLGWPVCGIRWNVAGGAQVMGPNNQVRLALQA